MLPREMLDGEERKGIDHGIAYQNDHARCFLILVQRYTLVHPHLLSIIYFIMHFILCQTNVYYFQACSGNGTMMFCVTPNLTDAVADMACGRRRKRNANDDALANHTVEFGFIFDGYRLYENANDYFDIPRAFVAPPPTFDNLSETQTKPNDRILVISGQYLTFCCNSKDYVVNVDNDTCTIMSLSVTNITCKLPEWWNQAETDTGYNVTVSRSSLLPDFW